MALTTAPLLDYDTLVSLAQADLYMASMGVTSWALASVPLREAALRRGTQYILARGLIPAALTPLVVQNVQQATSEAAMRALTNTLYRDVDPAAVVQKTVGPITVRYATPNNQGQFHIPIIDELLFGWTIAVRGPNQVEVVRI